MSIRTVQVGSDYSRCPCCGCSYIVDDMHHPACPVGRGGGACPFCGIPGAHAVGCPYMTGLFPVLARHIDADLTCIMCGSPFTRGECYTVARAHHYTLDEQGNSIDESEETAPLCLGCAWLVVAAGDDE